MSNTFGQKVVVADTSEVNNSTLGDYARIKNYAEVRDCVINDYSYVSQHTVINKTVVGKFTSIAHGCHIGLWEHNTDVTTHTFHLYETSGNFVKGYKEFDKDCVETRIGSDVWIGANSVILKGVVVADGAIIGAGSVVTKDVEPYAIVVGNPAREVKRRYGKEDVDFLQETKWWDFSRDVLQEMVDLGLFSSFVDFKKYVAHMRNALDVSANN